MAEINPTDAIPATNASNTTRYFNLPLFIATDKPSWLVDWNGAMNEIDSILQDINTSASGAESDVETVVTQVNQLSGVVSNLESLVNTAVSDLAEMQTTVDSHEERMDGIETDLITQNNLIKSLSDAVTTMQATVGTLNSRVSAMETTVAGYDSRITGAEQASASASAIASEVQAGLTSLTSTVNSISASVSSLNNRVTALENAPASPYLNDLNFTQVHASRSDFTEGTGGNATYTFTFANDCYFYAIGIIGLKCSQNQPADSRSGYAWFETYEGNDEIAQVLNINVSAPGLYGVSPDFENFVFKSSGTSAIYKVKAGTKLTIILNQISPSDTANISIMYSNI